MIDFTFKRNIQQANKTTFEDPMDRFFIQIETHAVFVWEIMLVANPETWYFPFYDYRNINKQIFYTQLTKIGISCISLG